MSYVSVYVVCCSDKECLLLALVALAGNVLTWMAKNGTANTVNINGMYMPKLYLPMYTNEENENQ